MYSVFRGVVAWGRYYTWHWTGASWQHLGQSPAHCAAVEAWLTLTLTDPFRKLDTLLIFRFATPLAQLVSLLGNDASCFKMHKSSLTHIGLSSYKVHWPAEYALVTTQLTKDPLENGTLHLFILPNKGGWFRLPCAWCHNYHNCTEGHNFNSTIGHVSTVQF